MKQIKQPSRVTSGTGQDFSSLDLDTAIDEMLAQARKQPKKSPARRTSEQHPEVPPIRPIHDDGWKTQGLVLINHEITCNVCGMMYTAPGDILVERTHPKHGKHSYPITDFHIYTPDIGLEELPHRVDMQVSETCGCKRCFDLATLIEKVLKDHPHAETLEAPQGTETDSYNNKNRGPIDMVAQPI